MGCDIHIIAEVKENGVWRRNTDEVFKYPYYNPSRLKKLIDEWKERLKTGDITQDEFDKWSNDPWYTKMEKEYVADPSDGRNYDWFAILADVRNGRGFAGVSTGAGFDIVDEPRGLPDDLSDEGLKYFGLPVTDDPDKEEENVDGEWVYYYQRDRAIQWIIEGHSKMVVIDNEEYVTNPDYHSSSFLTAEDFDNFDWNQVTVKYGTVTLDEYEELRKDNKSPESWCGDVWGSEIITINTEQADKILAGEKILLTRENANLFEPDKPPTIKMSDEWGEIYVGYEWGVVYREWFKHNIEDTVDPLRALAEKYEDARIVFAFDN